MGQRREPDPAQNISTDKFLRPMTVIGAGGAQEDIGDGGGGYSIRKYRNLVGEEFYYTRTPIAAPPIEVPSTSSTSITNGYDASLSVSLNPSFQDPAFAIVALGGAESPATTTNIKYNAYFNLNDKQIRNPYTDISYDVSGSVEITSSDSFVFRPAFLNDMGPGPNAVGAIGIERFTMQPFIFTPNNYMNMTFYDISTSFSSIDLQINMVEKRLEAGGGGGLKRQL